MMIGKNSCEEVDGKDLADLLDEFGYSAHQIVFGEDFVTAVAHDDKDGGAFVAKQMGDAFDGGVARDLRQRFAHHFANDQLAKVFALEGHIQDLVFEDGADDGGVFEDGQLRNILLLHGVQGVKDG